MVGVADAYLQACAEMRARAILRAVVRRLVCGHRHPARVVVNNGQGIAHRGPRNTIRGCFNVASGRMPLTRVVDLDEQA